MHVAFESAPPGLMTVVLGVNTFEQECLIALGHLQTEVLSREQPITVGHLLDGVTIKLRGCERRSKIESEIGEVVRDLAHDIAVHVRMRAS